MHAKCDFVIDAKCFFATPPPLHTNKQMEVRLISVQLAERELKVDPTGFFAPRAAHQFYTAKLNVYMTWCAFDTNYAAAILVFDILSFQYFTFNVLQLRYNVFYSVFFLVFFFIRFLATFMICVRHCQIDISSFEIFLRYFALAVFITAWPGAG